MGANVEVLRVINVWSLRNLAKRSGVGAKVLRRAEVASKPIHARDARRIIRALRIAGARVTWGTTAKNNYFPEIWP